VVVIALGVVLGYVILMLGALAIGGFIIGISALIEKPQAVEKEMRTREMNR
jgi:hypothetical protein